MLISAEETFSSPSSIYAVTPHVEFIRDGNQVTLELHSSAYGYYDPDAGYYYWDGEISATLGAASDYSYQGFDRPLDLYVTETLSPGVATAGSFEINYGQFSSTFSVILFDQAVDYAGGAGIQYVFGSDAADRMAGGAGDDGFEGAAGDDWLNGGTGGDLLDGGIGLDCASYAGAMGAVVARLYDAKLNDGEAGGDRYVGIENLEGSNFNDHLYGDGGSNTLWGLDGADALFGLGGNNIFVGGEGADWHLGGNGRDTASYADAAARVVVRLDVGRGAAGEALGDLFSSVENLVGSAFDDGLTGDDNANVLRGGAGNDVLRGLANDDRLIGSVGDDLLFGGRGADWLDGGFGIDTASYAAAIAGVRANLSDRDANTGEAVGDTYVSVENLTGSSHNDRLTGDDHENVIVGGDGNDFLSGGEGSDRLFGGAGLDSFIFDSELDPLDNVDRLLDYTLADDRIQLDDAAFGVLTPGGSIGAAAFTTGTAATTAAHRIIYNAANGWILYDADGVGGTEAVVFARTLAGLSMTSGEFFVI